MAFEDQHEPYLEALEATITTVARNHHELFDHHVDVVVDALIDQYVGEQLNRPPRNRTFKDPTQSLYAALWMTCEWCVGRGELPLGMDELNYASMPVETRILVGCLKRIKKSIKFWTKKGGRQGYLRYVEQFIP